MSSPMSSRMFTLGCIGWTRDQAWGSGPAGDGDDNGEALYDFERDPSVHRCRGRGLYESACDETLGELSSDGAWVIPPRGRARQTSEPALNYYGFKVIKAVDFTQFRPGERYDEDAVFITRLADVQGQPRLHIVTSDAKVLVQPTGDPRDYVPALERMIQTLRNRGFTVVLQGQYLQPQPALDEDERDELMALSKAAEPRKPAASRASSPSSLQKRAAARQLNGYALRAPLPVTLLTAAE